MVAGYGAAGAAAPRTRALVLLCDGLSRVPSSLDLEAIRGWLEAAVPGAEVHEAADLCRRPDAVAGAITSSGVTRLVLGLCGREYPDLEVQAAARRLGLDPFGIEVVSLGGSCAQAYPRAQAADRAKLLLRGALARAGAFAGSGPANVKPVLAHEGGWRALFTLPEIRYKLVPSIAEERCVAVKGCRVCISACPREALAPSADGRMRLDKARCTGCGACVSACPRTAVDLPGSSLPQVAAQLEALLATPLPSMGARGILFVCRDGATRLDRLAREGLVYPEGWLPVEVPCVGMVTPAWLLASLGLGAAAVGVLPCRRDDCRFGRPEVARGRVDYCRELLGAVGHPAGSVRWLDVDDDRALARALDTLPEPARPPCLERPVDGTSLAPLGLAPALLALAARSGAALEGAVPHPYSPLGRVEVGERCTACGACAEACPAGALTLRRDNGQATLAFQAGACVACEACVPVCPEAVLRLERTTDLRALAQGMVVLHLDDEARCEGCGGPVAPEAMLRRIAMMLEGGNADALAVVTRYCVSCREAMMWGGRPRGGAWLPVRDIAAPPGARAPAGSRR